MSAELDLDGCDLDLDAAEPLRALWAEAARRRAGRGSSQTFRVFTVLGKTELDYTFLDWPNGTTVTLQRAIPLPPFYHYWFAVRVHGVSISHGGFTFAFWNTLPCGTDPQEFTAATHSAFINLRAPAPRPPHLLVTRTSFTGPYCKATMTASQTSSSTPKLLYGEVSLVLFARAA